MNIKKTMTYDVANHTLCLGQAQICGRVELVNVMPFWNAQTKEIMTDLGLVPIKINIINGSLF